MENRKQNKTIKYFGYGANASGDMIKAIVGRRPKGIPGRLYNYELWTQSWQEIPHKARKILGKNWDSSFKTYCISPKRGKVVTGYIWFVTPKERKLISKWEFWYKPIQVKVKLGNNLYVMTETEIIKKPFSIKNKPTVIIGRQFFLNNKKQMLRVAQKVKELSARHSNT